MPSPRFLLRLPAIFATLVLVSIMALAPLRGQPSPGESWDENDAPLQVAELLDRIVQPHFVKDEGIFGLSRLLPPGHVPVYRSPEGSLVRAFRAWQGEGKELQDRADRLNRDYLIAFLHVSHVPGKGPRMAAAALAPANTPPPPVSLTLLGVRDARRQPFLRNQADSPAVARNGDQYDAAVRNKARIAALEKAAVAQIPRLQKGQKVDVSVGDWLVALRPVRASKAACLSCHTGAKAGDTLGVMVYAVDRAPTASATSRVTGP